MKINYITLLGMFFFASCSNNLEQIAEVNDFSDSNALKINVTAGDFAVEGEMGSRISDNGKTSNFEEGDRVGLIVLEDGTPIEKNNLPFIYSKNQAGEFEWIFDLTTAQKESKDMYYYNANKTNVTYIVYYPYSAAADNITTVDGLKSAFQPKEDQSKEENYRASDLLVWSDIEESAVESLDVDLSHAYSSFSLEVALNGTLDDGANDGAGTPYSAGEVSNMVFNIDGKTLTPFKAEDGTYRYILPTDFNGDVTWLYTNDGKNYSNTRTYIDGSAANKRYAQKESFANGKYAFANAQVGDFYCVTSDGQKGYLVPKDIDPEILKGRNCLGIVFRIKADGQDAVPYNDSFEYHGTVVALSDASEGLKWTTGSTESINNWVSSWSDKPEGLNITEKTKPQGWANTGAIKAYNQAATDEGKKVQQIAKLDAFATANPIPGTSTGWYWPSIFELRTMVCGQGREEMDKSNPNHNDGMKFLNNQYSILKSVLDLPNPELFLSGDYWSSTEVSATNAYSFNMHHNEAWFNQSGNDKNGQWGSNRLKPVFAF